MCAENIPANLVQEENRNIYLEKSCPEHGDFRCMVWQGTLDFEQWISGTDPMEEEGGHACPENCGICAEHESGTCCTLLEVTKRCNLRCRYCFADGGSGDDDPTLEEMKTAIDSIVSQCGQPLLQFSGGEPTLRDDLPELVRYAKEAGCSYTQLNTNGIRLAQDPTFAKKLKEAGLDIVFLQFDGTQDCIYETLRGKPLLQTKLDAVHACSELRIGVTLVPTVVQGVNDKNLGEIIRLAVSHAPAVRGIHFQPVSYFGRYPKNQSFQERYTLDRLVTDISEQTGIPAESFMPSRCDHPLCGFHANFLIERDGELKPLAMATHSSHSRGSARVNREYIARNWIRSGPDSLPEKDFSGEMDFDTFLYRVRNGSLTLTAMAFQDAMNFNIERLRRCSLHVYDQGKIKPFCAKYCSAVKNFL